MVELIPKTLKEALKMRAEASAGGTALTPVAGGTDLMVKYKSAVAKQAEIPSPLFIGGLNELKGISRKEGSLSIGACTTYEELLESDLIPVVFKGALIQIGSPAIRNQGTLGGNICNASPAGDTLPLLYMYRAELVLASTDGERIVPMEDFITGPGRTLLKENELLIRIRIKQDMLIAPHHYVFEKMGNRKADAISKAAFALRLSYDKKTGVIEDLDAAFGAMGPKVALLSANGTGSAGREIRDLVIGQKFPVKDLDRSLVKEKLYSMLIPIDDQRSTAVYRKNVALNLLFYYLTEADTALTATP